MKQLGLNEGSRKGSGRMVRSTVAVRGAKEKLFCIHNKKGAGCVGNSSLFWRVDGCGYTVNLDEAWKVSAERAAEICRSRPEEDFPVSYAILESLARRHVDIQALRAALKAQGSTHKRTTYPNTQTAAIQPKKD
jgi:hypothetical protein